MKITSVNVRITEKEDNKMKGLASVLIDNCFAIHELRVIEGKEGLFVAMPSRQVSDGTFKDIAHPINAETREKIQKAILEAYEAPETEESAE